MITVIDNRPKNLDLSTIELPVVGKASILHRVSGFILFFAIAFLIYALGASLESQASFDSLKEVMQHPISKFIIWGILSALGYHLVAGVKHLFMDMGVGEDLEVAQKASKATLVAGVVVVVLTGVWVW